MTRSRLVLLLLALVVVAVVGVTSIGSLPSPAGLVSGADEKVVKAARLTSEADAAQAALDDAGNFTAALAAARAAVPPTPQLGPLITELDALARAHNLEWLSGVPTRSTTASEGWTIDMKLGGDPGHVVSFLDALQALPRLVTVDTISLQAPEGIAATTTLTAHFYTTEGDLASFSDEEADAIRGALEPGDTTPKDAS